MSEGREPGAAPLKGEPLSCIGRNQAEDVVDPTIVRYVKFGRGGDWKAECLREGIIRLGMGSALPERLVAASTVRWADLEALFLANGQGHLAATRAKNETIVHQTGADVLCG